MPTFAQSKILIVDDDENYLASLRRVIFEQYELFTTTDPFQALDIIRQHGPFAVVISDFRMPRMNGIELFSNIIEIDKHIQKIMLTGHAELQMAIDAINHGKINAFLTKPVPSATLRLVVADAVKTYYEQAYVKLHPSTGSQPPEIKGNALPEHLTTKERQILALLVKGYSNSEISRETSITVGTVKTHLNNLFGKLEVNSRSKVVAKAITLDLIKPGQ